MATLEDLPQETRDELALLARDLSESPETRKDFLRLAKMKRPNMPVPELEIDERIAKTETEAATRIQQLENKLSERDMRDELQRRRNLLLAEGKAANSEEVEAIEKLMLEKGITSHETAADYHKWMQQAATPTPARYNRNVLDASAKDTLNKYWKNPVTAAREQAANALDEIRKNPRAVGF